VILVDSNILLDIFTEDPNWFEWSASTLSEYKSHDRLAINQLIYAEVSSHFENAEEVEQALPSAIFERVNIPWEAAFLAGRCFIEYKARGGARTSPLPDFYIGGHAAIAGITVMTRDPRRFRTYFPQVKLICPEA
jgi:predicted nucleic acid-binding protein